jgi:hypothetical protein
MANIELDTRRWALLDPDILASAVYNVELYFPGIQRLSIKFHFCEAIPVDRTHVGRIVSSLAKLEGLLPWHQRLMVQGFEGQEACQIAWGKKQRRWWE